MQVYHMNGGNAYAAKPGFYKALHIKILGVHSAPLKCIAQPAPL